MRISTKTDVLAGRDFRHECYYVIRKDAQTAVAGATAEFVARTHIQDSSNFKYSISFSQCDRDDDF